MGITKGYTFSPAETVTPAKLRQLVENAVLQGLSWSAIESSMNTISTGTGASKVGNIVCLYEPLTLNHTATPVSYSELNYVLRGPRGECSVFKNGGFESRRFHGNAANGPIGRYVLPTAAVGGSHLALNYAQAGFSTSVGLGHVLGFISYATATSAFSDASDGARIVLRGFCPIAVNAAATPLTIAHHRYVWGPLGIGGLTLSCSQATHWDHTYGIMLSQVHSMSSQCIPGWAFGSPLWRI